MLWTCYLRKGLVYIPAVAKIREGGHMDVEPVAVVPVSNSDGLRQAFRDTMARGNPVIPSPTRNNYPPAVQLKYAGVKTLSEFWRGTKNWHISDISGAFRIHGHRRGSDRHLQRDPEQVIAFAPGVSTDEIIDRMIAILQEAANGAGGG